MTSATTTADSNAVKFQSLLRELFQFDCAELDFGIYRIMNYKRDVVERFITESLPATVANELDSGLLAQQTQANEALEKARQNVIETLGATALGDNDELSDAFHSFPVGRTYLDAQARASTTGAQGRADVEKDIYNHLSTFFSRYYEDGDFISQRRYSGNQRYAIPYNGEEVYLHWANSDQYYVKTDEHFRNYDWQAPNGVMVHFRLRNANVEQNNVKGDKRFFLPIVADTHWDADARAVTIPVEYRPLNRDEANRHGNRDQQRKINEAAAIAIPQQIGNAPAALLTALTNERHNNGNGPVTHLLYHLRRYTTRNNSDFFIHKDLSEFLNRELDFYLKNEVLKLDNVANAGQSVAESWFQQMRLIKAVGGQIIDFLAQIEDFQKLLWEKHKFVTETQYCITLSNIGAEFYPDIIANEAQWNEWRELFSVDDTDQSSEFLQAHPTLVVDTKHFNVDFANRLLASFDNLDGDTDGLLMHSENWQALRLVKEKYQGQVKCIYIDPPYNSPSSEIVYKNGYKHSTWLTMMENRITATSNLIVEGVYTIAIDENEQERLGLLLDSAWTRTQRRVCVAVRHNPRGIQGKNFSHCHEYAYVIYPGDSKEYVGERTLEVPDVRNLRDSGLESDRSDARNCFYPIVVADEKVIGAGDVPDNTFHPKGVNEVNSNGNTLVWPIDTRGTEKKWRYARQSFDAILPKLEARNSRDKAQIYFAKDTGTVRTLWTESQFDASEYGTKLLQELFGTKELDFSYPKSLHTIVETVRVSTTPAGTDLILDYFAGSGTTGHAVINLNRQDGGERKFILVEMGEYFDTVLLPRIKKVTFTPEWKGGKPSRNATTEEAERSPRIVKYVRLESYEDVLDSIELDQPADQLSGLESSDEYLLKYLLRWETKDSETLLNVAKLASPFTYRLLVHANGERRERTVDLPETFNYLLGLNVCTRRTYDDGERRYLVYRGETRANPGRTVAVIWRATEGWTEEDFASDRDFVKAQELAKDTDTVYVNGDSCIPLAKPIEPMFKGRMFADANA